MACTSYCYCHHKRVVRKFSRPLAISIADQRQAKQCIISITVRIPIFFFSVHAILFDRKSQSIGCDSGRFSHYPFSIIFIGFVSTISDRYILQRVHDQNDRCDCSIQCGSLHYALESDELPHHIDSCLLLSHSIHRRTLYGVVDIRVLVVVGCRLIEMYEKKTPISCVFLIDWILCTRNTHPLWIELIDKTQTYIMWATEKKTKDRNCNMNQKRINESVKIITKRQTTRRRQTRRADEEKNNSHKYQFIFIIYMYLWCVWMEWIFGYTLVFASVHTHDMQKKTLPIRSEQLQNVVIITQFKDYFSHCWPNKMISS